MLLTKSVQPVNHCFQHNLKSMQLQTKSVKFVLETMVYRLNRLNHCFQHNLKSMQLQTKSVKFLSKDRWGQAAISISRRLRQKLLSMVGWKQAILDMLMKQAFYMSLSVVRICFYPVAKMCIHLRWQASSLEWMVFGKSVFLLNSTIDGDKPRLLFYLLTHH